MCRAYYYCRLTKGAGGSVPVCTELECLGSKNHSTYIFATLFHIYCFQKKIPNTIVNLQSSFSKSIIFSGKNQLYLVSTLLCFEEMKPFFVKYKLNLFLDIRERYILLSMIRPNSNIKPNSLWLVIHDLHIQLNEMPDVNRFHEASLFVPPLNRRALNNYN